MVQFVCKQPSSFHNVTHILICEPEIPHQDIYLRNSKMYMHRREPEEMGASSLRKRRHFVTM